MLRENDTKILSLPIEVRANLVGEVIAHRFTRVEIGSRYINAPFWMNKDSDWGKSLMFGAHYHGGKLSYVEVKRQAQQLFEERGIKVGHFSDSFLNYFLRLNHIGVDCSGLTYQVTKFIYQSLGGIDFENKVVGIDSSVGIARVNSNFLTNSTNSIDVPESINAKPGDIIRALGGKHSLTVISKFGNKLRCVHTSDFVPAMGSSIFGIEITNPRGHIFDQEWSEVNIKGMKYNHRLIEGYRPGDGLKRLKVMEELYGLSDN